MSHFGCDNFSDFVFDDLDNFDDMDEVFCRMSLNWDLSGVNS